MNEWFSKKNRRKAIFIIGVCILGVATVGHGALSEEAVREELRYIEALQVARMPDIADEVIADLKRSNPEIAALLKVSEIKGLLSLGKFDEVQAKIDAIADKNSTEYWALTLAKGDAYYAFGKYGDADKLYLEFFKKVAKPKDDLVPFYRDAAYKYVQMLLYLGKDRQALTAFGNLIDSAGKTKIPLDEDVERQVRADKAELMLKLLPGITKTAEKEAMLKEAEATVDKLLWKQDVWFGKALVMKAHLFLLQGDVKGAQGLVETYMPQLKIIHDAVKEQDPDGSMGMLRMSPMPQCRYLLAVLLMDEALAEAKKDNANEDHIKDLLLGERDAATKKRKQNGAMTHFVNVFIRFPESQWAADAGVRSEELRKFLKERYNQDVGYRVTDEQMRKVREMQFMGARLYFSQNQFKEAIDKYLTSINQFPDAPEAIAALGDLAFCYIESARDDADAALNAETVTGHLGERFCANERLMKEAGDQLRRIAERYGEMRMEDKRRQTYALFFRNYPTHYAAGQLVMSFGEREYNAQNYEGALGYYKQISEVYTNSPYYLSSFSRMAQVYKESGDVTNEITMLETYVDKLGKQERPGHALIVGQFRLAEVYREHGLTQLRAASTNVGDAAVSEAQQKAGVAWLDKAGASFTRLVELLDGGASAFQQTDDEKKTNGKLRETSLFSKALCTVQVNYPAEKLPAIRKLAITQFEEYVKGYPQGRYASKALMQIGTLYTILEDTPQAQAAFERLSRDYAESDEAKNSVPMQAAALIEIGLRGEGVAKYRQMLAAGGNYTEGQFMAAARALEEAREFDVAVQCYDKVLKGAKDAALLANAKLGRSRSLVGQKKFSEAHKELVAFIGDDKLSKLLLVVDANLLLVEVASEEGKVEKDDNERTRLFNEAVDALKMVKRYRTNTVAQVELDLKAGEILLRKMEAEKKLGLAEQSADTRGKAIVAFQVMIMNLDPGRAELLPILERAYYYCLPLLLEHKKYRDTQEDAERYLEIFPEGRYRTDVQSWLNQAKIGQ